MPQPLPYSARSTNSLLYLNRRLNEEMLPIPADLTAALIARGIIPE